MRANTGLLCPLPDDFLSFFALIFVVTAVVLASRIFAIFKRESIDCD